MSFGNRKRFAIWILLAGWPSVFPISTDAAERNASRNDRLQSSPSLEPRWIAQNPIHEQIRAKLSLPVALYRLEVPLEGILVDLERIYDLQIVLDNRALDDLGISPDTPITVGLRNVSLGSALRTILRPLDLIYDIVDEVLLVTSIDALLDGNFMKVRIYPVADLIEETTHTSDYVALVDTITSVIEPDGWIDAGGTCTIEVFRGSLVVAATEHVHAGVEGLLAALRDTAVQDSATGRRDSSGSMGRSRAGSRTRRRTVRLWSLDSAGNVVWAANEGH